MSFQQYSPFLELSPIRKHPEGVHFLGKPGQPGGNQADWLWSPGDPKCQSLEPPTGPNPQLQNAMPTVGLGTTRPLKNPQA